MADGWIELFDVETDEVELLLVFDRFEPVDYGCGVFPLVEVVFFRDLMRSRMFLYKNLVLSTELIM